MTLDKWKNILLSWAKGCFYMKDNPENLEDTDLEGFIRFCMEHVNVSASPPSGSLHNFLSVSYPEFKPNLDCDGHIRCSDYVYVYTFLLHYTCVLKPCAYFLNDIYSKKGGIKSSINQFLYLTANGIQATRTQLCELIAGMINTESDFPTIYSTVVDQYRADNTANTKKTVETSSLQNIESHNGSTSSFSKSSAQLVTRPSVMYSIDLNALNALPDAIDEQLTRKDFLKQQLTLYFDEKKKYSTSTTNPMCKMDYIRYPIDGKNEDNRPDLFELHERLMNIKKDQKFPIYAKKSSEDDTSHGLTSLKSTRTLCNLSPIEELASGEEDTKYTEGETSSDAEESQPAEDDSTSSVMEVSLPAAEYVSPLIVENPMIEETENQLLREHINIIETENNEFLKSLFKIMDKYEMQQPKLDNFGITLTSLLESIDENLGIFFKKCMRDQRLVNKLLTDCMALRSERALALGRPLASESSVSVQQVISDQEGYNEKSTIEKILMHQLALIKMQVTETIENLNIQTEKLQLHADQLIDQCEEIDAITDTDPKPIQQQYHTITTDIANECAKQQKILNNLVQDLTQTTDNCEQPEAWQVDCKSSKNTIDLQSQLKQSQQELCTLQHKWENSQDELFAMRQQFGQVKQQLLRKTDECKKLELRTLKQQLDKSQASDESSNQIMDLRQQVQDYQTKLSQSQQELLQKADEKVLSVGQTKKIINLEQQLGETRNELYSTQQQLDEVIQELMQTNAATQATASQDELIVSLKQQLNGTQSELCNAQQQLDMVIEELQQQTAECEKLKLSAAAERQLEANPDKIIIELKQQLEKHINDSCNFNKLLADSQFVQRRYESIILKTQEKLKETLDESKESFELTNTLQARKTRRKIEVSLKFLNLAKQRMKQQIAREIDMYEEEDEDEDEEEQKELAAKYSQPKDLQNICEVLQSAKMASYQYRQDMDAWQEHLAKSEQDMAKERELYKRFIQYYDKNMENRIDLIKQIIEEQLANQTDVDEAQLIAEQCMDDLLGNQKILQMLEASKDSFKMSCCLKVNQVQHQHDLLRFELHQVHKLLGERDSRIREMNSLNDQLQNQLNEKVKRIDEMEMKMELMYHLDDQRVQLIKQLEMMPHTKDDHAMEVKERAKKIQQIEETLYRSEIKVKLERTRTHKESQSINVQLEADAEAETEARHIRIMKMENALKLAEERLNEAKMQIKGLEAKNERLILDNGSLNSELVMHAAREMARDASMLLATTALSDLHGRLESQQGTLTMLKNQICAQDQLNQQRLMQLQLKFDELDKRQALMVCQLNEHLHRIQADDDEKAQGYQAKLQEIEKQLRSYRIELDSTSYERDRLQKEKEDILDHLHEAHSLIEQLKYTIKIVSLETDTVSKAKPDPINVETQTVLSMAVNQANRTQ